MSNNLDILKNFNILYLEDDVDLLKHTSDVLEDCVNKIDKAANSMEAMNFVLNEKIDVIISDIELKDENYIVKPINIKELLETIYKVLLPKIKEFELKKNINIIKTISIITDSKQVDIVKHIFNNLN